jgi:cell division protein FtsB
MATFQQRKDPMRLMWRRLLAVLLLILIAIALRGVWGVYKKSQDSYILRVEAQAKLDDLQKRERELRADSANLRNENGIEAELRERYNLAKEGESVIVIVDPPAVAPEPKPTTFQKFKSWFRW